MANKIITPQEFEVGVRKLAEKESINLNEKDKKEFMVFVDAWLGFHVGSK